MCKSGSLTNDKKNIFCHFLPANEFQYRLETFFDKKISNFKTVTSESGLIIESNKQQLNLINALKTHLSLVKLQYNMLCSYHQTSHTHTLMQGQKEERNIHRHTQYKTCHYFYFLQHKGSSGQCLSYADTVQIKNAGKRNLTMVEGLNIKNTVGLLQAL